MQKAPVTYSSANLFSVGIGHVVVARFKSGGRVDLGVFLVDTYCLGVKDAFFRQGDETILAELLDRSFGSQGFTIEEHSGAWGRKLVEGAVAYARNLGIAPHRDYKKACRVLGGIDPKTCPDSFVFGHNGKPLFVAGPYDSAARCRVITSVLTRTCGDEGFQLTRPLDDQDDDFEMFDVEEDDDEEFGEDEADENGAESDRSETP